MWRKALLTILLPLAVPAVALAQYNSVTLAWNANSEPDIAGYVVYWGTSSGSYGQSQSVGNATQITINGLEDLRTYYFVVRAYNTDGLFSGPSSEVSTTIPDHPDRVRGARSRLFWRHNESGAVASWHMDGNLQISGGPVGSGVIADLNWQVVGTGDFNGDGYTDLVWHHATEGWISVWLLLGDTMIDGRLLTPNRVADVNWRIAAVGDFNQDGRSDLIWQHPTQGVAVWIMNGTTLVEGHLLSPSNVADARWKIIGAGDYDLDGHTDLFWRHDTTGQLSAWRMNRSTMVGGTSLTPGVVTDLGWRIVALTDFNDDGRPDLVWQHDNGMLATWVMNGTSMVSGKPLMPGTAPAAWRIVGAGR